MARTHLIRDRTDPADPGRDIRNILKRAASQQRFKQTGWLEDVQLNFFDRPLTRANGDSPLTFDASQNRYGDRFRINSSHKVAFVALLPFATGCERSLDSSFNPSILKDQ